MDVGDWTGRTLGSVRRTKLWKMVQGNPSRFHFPGGESFIDAEARLLDELERVVARHPRGHGIGTHGDLVRIATSRTSRAPTSTSSSARSSTPPPSRPSTWAKAFPASSS